MGCGSNISNNSNKQSNTIKISVSKISLEKITKDFYSNITLCKDKFIGPYFLLDHENSNLGTDQKIDYYSTIERLLEIIQYNKIECLVKKISIDQLHTIDLYNKSLIDNIYLFNTDVINSDFSDSMLNQGNFKYELKHIALTGIPQLFRYTIWKHLMQNSMNASKFKAKILLKKDYAEYSLRANIADDKNDDKGTYKKVIGQIKCDIERTCPHSMYLYDGFYKQLERLLQTIAMYDLNISYVQGLNFICAYLIFMFGSEEYLAFEIFLRMMNLESKLFKMPYKNMITDEFPLLNLYFKKFNKILQNHHEDLFIKFNEYEFNLYLWLSKWLQTLFAHDFNYYVVTRLWDIIIAEDMDIIILISVYLVEFQKEEFLQCESIEELLEVTKNLYAFDFNKNLKLIDYIVRNIQKKKYFEEINKSVGKTMLICGVCNEREDD